MFGGTNEGGCFALTATTGRPPWHFQTGAMVDANPIAFAINGKRCVAIATGMTLQMVVPPQWRDGRAA